jgi:UTP--glucose-1-phosphate uridylyltransferase
VSETKNYGIVAGDRMRERLTRLRKLIEKPAPGVTDSRLAIVGRYLFTPSVFEAIERTKPGYGGEIQITDAMQLLADEEGMFAYEFEGDRFDTGRPLSLLIANIAMALRRPDIGPDLRRYLLSLELNES